MEKSVSNSHTNPTSVIDKWLTIYVVDTNSDCSVLVIDSFYMIKFRTAPVAQYVLYLAYKLRSAWNRLLNLRISRGIGKVWQMDAKIEKKR